MDELDFAVIGGGIAGASAAYELAARGSVVLLEREAVCGYHTTGRSAAVFTEAYERGPVRLLTMASRGFLEAPPAGFVDESLLSPLPVLFVGREDQRARVVSIIEETKELVEIEHLQGSDLMELCPVLRDGHLVAGAYEPAAMEIDVHALHQGFLTGIRQRGGAVRVNAAVESLSFQQGSWRISAGGAEFAAPIVVNAAGAWADQVAELARVPPVGLNPLRRTAFTFDPPGGDDVSGWPMVVDADEDFYFKPERTQILGSLAEETPMPPHDVRHEEVDVALAIDRIQTATTMQIRHVSHAWAGLRTFSPDRFPVVGLEGDSGFCWLAGQGGYGIMTSPAMARAATGLVCDGGLPDDLLDLGLTAEAIGPGRFRS